MLKVEYVKTDSLKTYGGNAKLHPADQIEQIKKSIEEFGFNDPIAVWQDNEIIEGHGRLIAAQELGLKELPIIRLDDITDNQRRAYALVHNKLTMNSGFDIAILQEELSQIESIPMSDYGFETAEEIRQALEDFFTDEETGEKEKAEKDSDDITFIIKVYGEKRSQVMEYLNAGGYKYEA